MNSEHLFLNHCPLCSSKNLSPFISIERYHPHGYGDIVKCSSCDHIFCNPMHLGDAESYNSKNYVEDMYLKNIPQSSFEHHLFNLERYNFKKGKLLEIGCLVGYFLDLANKGGWKTYGIEPSKLAVDWAKENLNINIQHGFFKSELYSNTKFDAIVSIEVIEHVPNPLDFLQGIRQVLAPLGMVMLTTPNIESKGFKQEHEKWHAIDPFGHLHYFSKKTLTLALKQASLTPIRFINQTREDSLIVIACHKKWIHIIKILLKLKHQWSKFTKPYNHMIHTP